MLCLTPTGAFTYQKESLNVVVVHVRLSGGNFSVDIRVNGLPQPDNQDNNADSCKHQDNHRYSNTCHQDSVTRQLRVISLVRGSGYSRDSVVSGYSSGSGYSKAIYNGVHRQIIVYTVCFPKLVCELQ